MQKHYLATKLNIDKKVLKIQALLIFPLSCVLVMSISFVWIGADTLTASLSGASAFWVAIFCYELYLYMHKTNQGKDSPQKWIRRVCIGKIMKLLLSSSLLVLAYKSHIHLAQCAQIVCLSYVLCVSLRLFSLPIYYQRG